jgi:mono/diheme cytochrome c family protein
MRLLLIVGSVLMGLAYAGLAHASDNDPKITIRNGSQTIELKRSELLKRPDVVSIHVPHDPSYEFESKDYRYAVPLKPILDQLAVPEDAIIEFNCLDGYAAPLSKERLLGAKSPDDSTPYLAIEPPGEKWPMAFGKPPGPFYLIWTHPEKAKVGTEEWPFALSGFTIKEPLSKTFPKIVPANPASPAVQRGFSAFTKNCFTCHTLNGEGQSQMGPDLNLPMSPTEYFSAANLKKLIRNPQNLRRWPESKMRGFTEQELSDAEISDIIAYLRHMSAHRGSP